MDQQEVYNKQKKLSLAVLISDLPNMAAVAISAFVSNSLIVWLDFIDSLSGLLGDLIVVLLSRKMSKDLRYEYNYGVGKIEAMTALMSEGLEVFGLLFVLGFSVYQLFFPEKPSDLLIFVVVLKVLNVCVDAVFLKKQYDINKLGDTHVTQSEVLSEIASLLFDAAALVSLLFVWLLRNSIVSWYISPILSLVIASVLIVMCVKHIRHAVSELADKTLPEEEQLKILKVLTKHDKEYSSFGSIKSRCNGTSVTIDISVSFAPETTFEEILKFQHEIQQELSENIEGCNVAVVIDGTE